MFLLLLFFQGKHSGRVLTLQPNNGTADLNAVFYGAVKKNDLCENGEPSKSSGQRKHIICVNTYQVLILAILALLLYL
jgi:cullin 3